MVTTLLSLSRIILASFSSPLNYVTNAVKLLNERKIYCQISIAYGGIYVCETKKIQKLNHLDVFDGLFVSKSMKFSEMLFQFAPSATYLLSLGSQL